MRNKMHNFGSSPAANIPRSRFDLSQNVKFTGNTGKLIPFYVQEVLPGDTFDVSTSIVCRLQTLIHPLMDNLYLDTYYFFVPNRLVWDNWKYFCGEANKAWVSNRDYTIPKIIRLYTFNSDQQYKDRFKDHIVDYMGVGINPNIVDYGNNNCILGINALPIRAYNKIYDDWFRDENLIDPVNIYTGDNNVDGYSTNANAKNPTAGGLCYDACKLHDYFTSALPQAQRGNPVSLTTGDIGKLNVASYEGLDFVGDTSLKGYLVNNTTNPPVNIAGRFSTVPGSLTESAGYTMGFNTVQPLGAPGILPSNLGVNMSGVNLGISINDLRMAFAVQRWMEKSARGGSRYIEIIKTMFGVESPDARMQRSEYLGGHRIPINIHQIVNTSETIDAPLGNTGAMSVTSDVHNDFIHSFTEHGFVIGIGVVRYKHTYPQGLDRMWNRETIFDFYWPSFAFIGEQPIRNSEIYLPSYPELSEDSDLPDKVFGYNEAWADYRYRPNRCMGEMRPGVPNTLASWTLADLYFGQPILGSTWIKETMVPVDRAIAVTSEVADQFLFDVLINNKATRPMPLYSIPGLVDHF